MTIRSMFTGALLGAVVVSGISSGSSAVAATSVADQNATTTFNVYLPLTNTAALEDLLSQQTDSNSPNYHKWLTPGQFKQQFGPSSTSFAAARAALEGAGLTIVAEHTQNLTVLGSVAAVEKLFSTQLKQVPSRNGNMHWGCRQPRAAQPAGETCLPWRGHSRIRTATHRSCPFACSGCGPQRQRLGRRWRSHDRPLGEH